MKMYSLIETSSTYVSAINVYVHVHLDNKQVTGLLKRKLLTIYGDFVEFYHSYKVINKQSNLECWRLWVDPRLLSLLKRQYSSVLLHLELDPVLHRL